MKASDTSSNSRKGSQPPPPSNMAGFKEIVLLEENDLYKYHRSTNQHIEQPRMYRASAAAPHTHPAQGRSSVMTTSSQQTSEHGHNDVSRPSARPYQLHATPSLSRKPSINSVDTIPLNHGAIRPGGPVALFQPESIGLLLNWTIIGFFNGCIPAMSTPVLLLYLGYDDAQFSAASALLLVPLGCKFLLSFLVDCVPINRQRRKPYMMIGWTIFALFMIAMTIMHQPEATPRTERVELDSHHGATPDEEAAGTRYVTMAMFSSFAHLLSTVAAEGLMVEYAQREGEFVRGKTQCICMVFRFCGEVIGTLSVALALNSPEYGGDFSYALPLRVIFGAYAVIALSAVVITKMFLIEEQSSIGSQRFTTQLRRVWSIMQQRTTWQITVFGFLQKVSTGYEVQESRHIYAHWLGSEAFTLNAANAIGSAGYVLAAGLYMRYFLNTNWHSLMIVSVILGLVVMVPVDMFTVYDILRSETLYLIKVQVTGICDALLHVLRVITIIEVAEPGYEAVTYGIITTVFNLGTTTVTLTKNLVATSFTEDETNLELDTDRVRTHLMHEFLFKYGIRLLMMVVVLPLLPRQKRHLKEIKVRGNPTLVIPIVLFLLFTVVFVLAAVSNWLAMFESTRCLPLAGGKGCHPVQ